MSIYKKGDKTECKRVKFSLGKDTYIMLRELSSKEFLDLQADHGDKPIKNMDFVFNLILLCAVDDTGSPIFDSLDDIKQNLDIGTSQFIGIQTKIMEISGIADQKKT